MSRVSRHPGQGSVHVTFQQNDGDRAHVRPSRRQGVTDTISLVTAMVDLRM